MMPMYTRSGSGYFAGRREAVKWRIVAVHHHGVDRVSLLELKQELFHCLAGVVPTQIDHHLLNLRRHKDRKKTE